MKRRLTKRERVLLIIFGVSFILWSANTFVMKPQAEKIESLNAEKRQLDDEITNVSQILHEEKNMKEELSDAKSSIIKLGNSYFLV